MSAREWWITVYDDGDDLVYPNKTEAEACAGESCRIFHVREVLPGADEAAKRDAQDAAAYRELLPICQSVAPWLAAAIQDRENCCDEFRTVCLAFLNVTSLDEAMAESTQQNPGEGE